MLIKAQAEVRDSRVAGRNACIPLSGYRTLCSKHHEVFARFCSTSSCQDIAFLDCAQDSILLTSAPCRNTSYGLLPDVMLTASNILVLHKRWGLVLRAFAGTTRSQTHVDDGSTEDKLVRLGGHEMSFFYIEKVCNLPSGYGALSLVSSLVMAFKCEPSCQTPEN